MREKIQTHKFRMENRLLAGVWKTVSAMAFACIVGFVRYLSLGSETLLPLPVHQIVFVENLMGLVLITPLIFKLGFQGLKTSLPKAHGLRAICACLGILCWYYALKHMQIGYASALAFLGPVFTVIGGVWIFRETLTPLKNLAIFSSFVGAFLIIRPDLLLLKGEGFVHEVGIWALLPILSAMFIAGAKLIARRLAGTGESPELMTIYLMFALIPTTLFPALVHWVPLQIEHFLSCTALGGLVVLAHYSTSKAYSYSGVNFLTPFSFLRLILGIALGYVLFGELPTETGAWIGIGVILISILLLTTGRKSAHEKA